MVWKKLDDYWPNSRGFLTSQFAPRKLISFSIDDWNYNLIDGLWMGYGLFEYNGKKICWLGHDGFQWEAAGKVIIIDPFQLSEDPGKADIVITTHEHFDHCSPDDLPKVVGENTTIVAPPSCKDQVEKDVNMRYIRKEFPALQN